ncbi:MAG: EAL domain-containing protein [Alphaproteobacteria bacterium]|nr:EAL domain-containing protein [Alphaproteobacteria bacterium]
MSFSNFVLSFFSSLSQQNSTFKKKKNLSATNSFKVATLQRSAATQIWKSRLSWRIASVVFLTILIVQILILSLTVRQEEQRLLNDLREVGRSAIAPLLETPSSLYDSPLESDRANRLISSTIVNGLTIYSSDLLNLGSYGEPVSIMMLNQDSLSRTYRSFDGGSYEVVYRPNDLRKSYIIVARLNSQNVDPAIVSYVRQNIVILLLLSAFVTTVLMIALGHWLLEPILFMRNNLIIAQQNPENPRIQDSPFNPKDEIGGAIEIAQSLIRKNAESMQQVRAAAEDKIHKLAYFDQLTGLPNRTLFVQKLTEQAFAGEDESTKRFAVVTLDLDHFKDINDSMGHSVGDAILRGVAKRLRASLPEGAVVARAGEDEFAVTMPLNTDLNTARDVGAKVASIIKAEPFKVFNESFQIRTSIGVATYPDDGKDPNDVLKNADIALNRAKEEGRDRIREYSEDFDKVVQQRFQLLRDLRDALENEDLDIFYQPQFDLRTGQIIGAEALLRWWKKDNSKEGGSYISPAEFIPIAEQSGLIVPIGSWVMKEACRTAKKWHDAGKNIRIAVNVSGAQFFQGDLVEYTKEVLKKTGVKPELLELEVTESVFMDDISIALDTLHKLHKLGVELAIDDFGTGYSSLSYLRQFNIDRLKIDQSFIRNALTNNDDAAIAKTIINLGHSLNLSVIAEGVETYEHERFLIEHGCDEVQGFRYSKPIPKDDFWKFASEYNGSLESFRV